MAAVSNAPPTSCRLTPNILRRVELYQIYYIPSFFQNKSQTQPFQILTKNYSPNKFILKQAIKLGQTKIQCHKSLSHNIVIKSLWDASHAHWPRRPQGRNVLQHLPGLILLAPFHICLVNCNLPTILLLLLFHLGCRCLLW